ncbi:MAG: Asp-tRNA(Asn)/Glu-tRNA(Gln) amidotransferase subunit GatC [Gemmatimonadaceae bacterium]
MPVSEKDVRKIADLARLSLADTDLPAITEQMNSILAHMDVLTRVDTTSIESVAVTPAGGMPLRDDRVAPIPMSTTAPLLAPDSRDGFILVPRLATHEDV